MGRAYVDKFVGFRALHALLRLWSRWSIHRACPGPSAKVAVFRALLAPAWVHRVCLLPPTSVRPVLLVVASIVWTGMYPAFGRDQGRHVSRPASYSAGLTAEHEAAHAGPAACRRAPLSRRRFARHMLRRTLILNCAGHAGGPAAVSDEGGRLALIDCNLTRHLRLVRALAGCNCYGHFVDRRGKGTPLAG